MKKQTKTKLQKDVDYLNEKIDKIDDETSHNTTYTETWVIAFFVTFLFSVIAIFIFVPFDSVSHDDFCKEKYGNFTWAENTDEISPKYFMCKNIDENNTIIKKYITIEEYEQWKKTK